MRRRSVLPLVATIAVAASGCYAMDIDATELAPHVYLSARTVAGETPQRVGEIDTQVTGAWVLWGLVVLRDPDIGDALARELGRQQATGVTGLEIRTQQTFVDGLLGVITLGIYGRRTAFVRGTVVR